MFRIFCCRSKKASTQEVDEITDSIEKCLSMERGLKEFRLFLTQNNFQQELKTLGFTIKCQNTLREISKLSPSTRNACLPLRIQKEIDNLCEMLNYINFDSYQMNFLEDLQSSDVESKIYALKMAELWSVELLQDVFKAFRRNALKTI